MKMRFFSSIIFSMFSFISILVYAVIRMIEILGSKMLYVKLCALHMNFTSLDYQLDFFALQVIFIVLAIFFGVISVISYFKKDT